MSRQSKTTHGLERVQSGTFLRLFSAATLLLLGACAPTPDAVTDTVTDTVMVGDIEVRMDGLSARDNAYRVDEVTFELDPGEGMEYKYRLEQDEPMVYSWTSSGPVRSEMHSEADGQAEGTAEFFEVIESSQGRNGTFTAPFPGIHGWYWLNLNEDEGVSVTVRSSGFYSYAMEFSDGSRQRYEPPAVDQATETE